MLSKQKSEKAVSAKKHHGFIKLLAFAAIIVSVVFTGYTIISDSMQIKKNKAREAELIEQTVAVLAQNEQMTGYLENDEKRKTYIEEMARDKLDFANGDERIYYVIPAGN